MNDFDELFNEYFGDEDNNNKRNDAFEEKRKSITNLINRLNMGDSFSGVSPEEANLGEPTSTRIVEKDGIRYEEATWERDFGAIYRLTAIEDLRVEKEEELSLEEKLEIAKKEENYEECARLRDQIENKLEEKEKFKENKETAENLNNKGFPEDGDWNF